MKIEGMKIYTMHLTDKEFDLLDNICSKSVDYGYNYYNGYWRLNLISVQMMERIQDLLKREYNYQLNIKNNKEYAIEIRTLLDNIEQELY